MLFNSAQFLVFFPVVILVYFKIPEKVRYLWLLFASYYFYMSWDARYGLLIFTSTVVTWGSALVIDAVHEARLRKITLTFCLCCNLGLLFYFKYINFAADTLRELFRLLHVDLVVPETSVLLPVGISFYTFQALGYTIDVYRKTIGPEKNFFRYALFVSFFPQLVAGPIERSKNLLGQLAVPHRFDYDRFREGFLLMLWGYFTKIVIADRITIFVSNVLEKPSTFPGLYIVIAVLLFNLHVYCDFYGYSSIATGAARILGIDLMENFNVPFASRSTPEYWRRWHISLTSWFRDYLYFPLGGSRKGKARKYRNIMIVFIVSGLWHGASFSYVIWGALNGFLQIAGELLKPVKNRLNQALHLNENALSHKFIQMVVTYGLISLTCIFLYAENIAKALNIIRHMLYFNPWILVDKSIFLCGLNGPNLAVLFLSICVLAVADICKYHGIVLHKLILKQEYWFRWLVFIFSIWGILVFGIWGVSFDPAAFYYFQF